MGIQLINIGFGNIVAANRIVAIVSPESAPIKRLVQEARDRGMLIDATYGRRTRAVIIADSDHIILSAVQPETVAHRLTSKDKLEANEKKGVADGLKGTQKDLRNGGLKTKGFLIVLSGPSGAGKNSVMNAVFPTIPNLKYSVSVTTRPPRVGEVHAVNYFFVSEEEFDKMLAADLLLESATFVGYRYGTPKKYVYEQIEAGNAVIMDIDIQGAAQIKRKMPE